MRKHKAFRLQVGQTVLLDGAKFMVTILKRERCQFTPQTPYACVHKDGKRCHHHRYTALVISDDRPLGWKPFQRVRLCYGVDFLRVNL